MTQGFKRTTAAILAALILAGAGASVAVFSGVGTTAFAEEAVTGTVCTDGTTAYSSLQNAFNTAPDGATITMTADITDFKTADIATVPTDKTFTLDMAGHSITVAASNDPSPSFVGRPIVNNGTLTITGNGTIDTSASEFGGYGAVNNFGTLIIENGTFKGSINSDGAGVFVRPGSVATIRDGYFEGTRAVNNSGTLTIDGGTFYTTSCNQTTDSKGGKNHWAYCITSEGTLYFNDGSVTGVQGGLGIANGYAEVTGGTFQTVGCEHSTTGQVSFYALYIAGEAGEVEAHISGGTYTSISRVAVLCGNDNTGGDGGINAKATAYISGGTFNGGSSIANGTALNYGANTGDPQITGGTYSSDVSDRVVDNNAVATIGNTDYYYVGPTAVEAVQNASEGETVTVRSGNLVADDVPKDVVIKIEGDATATINGVDLANANKDEDGNYIVPEKPTVTPPPTVVTYTVTFQTNGGTQVAAQGVTSGTALTVPTAPTKEGYTFAGWFTDEALTQAYDFTQPVTGNLALYAKWTENVTVDQVQNVKAVKKATTWLKLNFDKVDGADGYEIYNAETGEKLADCTTQNGRAVLTKTVTGLEKGTTYKLQVCAYKLVDGERVYGEASPIYTKATAHLDKVTGVRPIKKTQTTLKIQFNQVEGAERYKIFDAESGKMICTVSTQGGADVLKKTITGLKAGETRQYKVRAYATINGKSEYGEFSNTLVKATAE